MRAGEIAHAIFGCRCKAALYRLPGSLTPKRLESHVLFLFMRFKPCSGVRCINAEHCGLS